MKSQSKEMLKEVLKEARLKNGLIDRATVDDLKIEQFIAESKFASGIHSALIWQSVSHGLMKIWDKGLEDRAVTDEEKERFANRVYRELSSAPYSYDFYYKLPPRYAGETGPLSEAVEVVRIDEAFRDKLGDELFQHDILSALKLDGEKKPRLEPDKYYLKISDRGLVYTGNLAYVESNHAPDRIFGLFIGIHMLEGNIIEKWGGDSYDSAPKVYRGTKYASNFVSPLTTSAEKDLIFNASKTDLAHANRCFTRTIEKTKNKEINRARVQISNSIYWYLDFLNTASESLKIVKLISAFDSLIVPEYDEMGNTIIPTAQQKVPQIVESIARSETNVTSYSGLLRKAFNIRNEIIHGSTEILSFEREAHGKRITSGSLAYQTEDLYTKFVRTRLSRLVDTSI